MCGIAGAFSIDKRRRPCRRVVEDMTAKLRHRGPDATGYYESDIAIFGHQRLSILDFSDLAAQPIVSHSGRQILVFSGEIYNYRGLRAERKQAGHTFRSQSDGEVILALYEHYGPSCLSQLEGMFAIAIADLDARTLFLARDRAGEKPLYYAKHDGMFYFASEIKAFWKIPGLPRRMDKAAIIAHFTHTQPPPPDSIYEGISKIAPGYTLSLDQEGVECVTPYWSLDYTKKFEGDFQEAVSELNSALAQAVRGATISDRPVGIMLSGGVDSTTTLAHLPQDSQLPIMSFSLKAGAAGGFDSDLARAAAVAGWYQTTHRDYHFTVHSFSETRAVLSHFDEPIGVYDAVFAYCHSQAISKHCQVLLTGSGADEIFGGYSSYLEYCPAHGARFEYAAKDQIDRLLADEFNRVARKDAELLYEGATEFLANEIDSYERLRPVFRLGNYDNILDGKLFIELTAGMSHCASLFDMTGMAHGVEFRSAFFNHKILELGARMPPHWKVDRNHRFQTKLVLKQAAAKVLPAHLFRDIVDSPKCGYGHALDRMSLIRGEWRAEIDAVLERNAPCLEGIIDPGKVRNLLARLQDPGMTMLEGRRVLKLVLFLAWLDGQDLQEAS